MGRAERTGQALEVATALRLATAGVVDEGAARRLRRAERLVRSSIGASVPKRRAAASLGISVPALQRWTASGRLPVIQRPGGREEVEAAALLDLLAEVRRLREDEAVTRGAVAEAFRRLAERDLPRPVLRPNVSAQELRRSFLSTTGVERLREAAELSHVATTLAGLGAARRVRDQSA